MLRRHAHSGAKDWWGRSGAVGCASWTGVVLRTSPAKANTRVTNRVALHLVDSHLGSVTLHKLDETAPLAWGNLDIGNLAETLEEGAKLILGDVAGQATDENSGVVWVGELVHGLRSAVVAHRGSAHGIHAHARAAATLLHLHATRATRSTTLVLGGCSADAHRPVAAVDALHLSKGLLLVFLASEADKSVTTRHAADGVGHDLGRLSGGVLVLEELHENKLGDFWAEVANEDGVLGTTLIATVSKLAFLRPRAVSTWLSSPAISKAAAGGPVELERAVGVRDKLAIEAQSLGRSIGASEINKAVSSVTAAQISLLDATPLIGPRTQRICRGSS